MRAKMITPESRPYFRHLIGPGAYQLMERGGPVTAIGLLERKKPIGAVAGMLDENDIFTVLSLFVAESYRRKGGGSLLMYALISLLEEANSGTAILSFVEDPGEESSDTSFFRFMDSLEINETSSLEHLYKLPLGSLYSSPVFSSEYKSRFIVPLTNLTMHEKEAFLKKYGEMNNGWMGEWFSAFKPVPELSYIMLRENRISGYLLLEKGLRSDTEFLISISGDSDAKATGALLCAFVSACRNKIPPDKTVLIPVLDDRYERLFEQLHDVRNLQHNYIF